MLSPTAVEGAARLEVTDHDWPAPVTLSFPRGAVWRFPLETVSNSEAGFERTFQGLSCLCVWPIELRPGGTLEVACECVLGR